MLISDLIPIPPELRPPGEVGNVVATSGQIERMRVERALEAEYGRSFTCVNIAWDGPEWNPDWTPPDTKAEAAAARAQRADAIRTALIVVVAAPLLPLIWVLTGVKEGALHTWRWARVMWGRWRRERRGGRMATRRP